MAGRLLVLVFALVLAGFAVIALHDESSCRDQSARMIRMIAGHVPPSERFADEFIDECRGTHKLALAANGLARKRKTAALAVRVSDEAIRREPRNFEGWVALSSALRRRGLVKAADRALREARRLNPRFGQGPG